MSVPNRENAKRMIFIIIFFVLSFSIFIIKYEIRPLYRLAFLSWMPSFLGALSVPFLLTSLKKVPSKQSLIKDITYTVLLTVLYEIFQYFDDNSTFDLFDILFSLLGILLAYFILNRLID